MGFWTNLAKNHVANHHHVAARDGTTTCLSLKVKTKRVTECQPTFLTLKDALQELSFNAFGVMLMVDFAGGCERLCELSRQVSMLVAKWGLLWGFICLKANKIASNFTASLIRSSPLSHCCI
jgi:hypothetical protein